MPKMMDTQFKSQNLTDLAALHNRRVTEGRADQPFNLEDLLEYYEAIGRIDLASGIRRKMLEARIAVLLAVPPVPTMVKPPEGWSDRIKVVLDEDLPPNSWRFAGDDTIHTFKES